jgi:hypothetical protein
MPDLTILKAAVADVSKQIRVRRAEFYGLRGLFGGAFVALLPLILRDSLGWSGFLWAGVCLAGGALAGAVTGFLMPLPAGEAARLADRGYGLQDRVATALEWADRPDRTPLVDALVADAVARVQAMEGRRVVPRRIPREARFVPVPLVLGIALALAPAIPLPQGALPSLSGGRLDDEEKAQERAGSLESQERPRGAKREDARRAEVQERTFGPRAGAGGATQPGDISALFKDTSLAGQTSDFNAFLKKGDERIRMLEQIDRLPDLQRDFTQSKQRMVFQKAKSLRGGLKGDQFSPDKLRELLREMERLGRKGDPSYQGDLNEGMDALEGGQSDRAMEAMERALNKLRSMEEKGRDGKGLRGGREDERRGGRRGERGPGGAPGDEGDWPEGEGSLPGKGKSANRKGDPSQRLNSNPFDVGVEGEARSGRKDGMDTNLVGRGGNVPSRLQYMGVLGQYRKQMEEDIVREQVPRDYHGQVKDYFKALDEK